MKMRKMIAAAGVLILVSGISIAEGKTWNIRSFVEAYVLSSDTISNQDEKIAELELDLAANKARRESALFILEKELELETARRESPDIRNAELIKAADLYLAYIAAVRSVESAQTDLAITKKEEDITRNRYDAGDESDTTLLNKRISTLQTKKTLSSSLRNLEKSRTELLRSLSLDENNQFSTDFVWSESSGALENITIEEMRLGSSGYFHAVRSLEIKENQLALKRGSNVFTDEEINDAADQVEDAKNEIQTLLWNLEDERTDLSYEIAAHNADAEIRELNLRLKSIELDDQELKYSYGEVLDTELENARINVREAEIAFLEAKESLFQLRLKAAAASGGDCVNVFSDWIDK